MSASPMVGGVRVSLAFHDAEELDPRMLQKRPETIELDISHNRIRDLSAIESLRQLRVLIADDNLVSSSTYLPHLPNLHTLSLNANAVSNLAQFVRRLEVSAPGIRHLSLLKNEACPNFFNGGTAAQYADYRLYVISRLPNLAFLDDSAVTDEERLEASRLYKCIPTGNIKSPGLREGTPTGSASPAGTQSTTTDRRRRRKTRDHKGEHHPERHHRDKERKPTKEGSSDKKERKSERRSKRSLGKGKETAAGEEQSGRGAQMTSSSPVGDDGNDDAQAAGGGGDNHESIEPATVANASAEQQRRNEHQDEEDDEEKEATQEQPAPSGGNGFAADLARALAAKQGRAGSVSGTPPPSVPAGSRPTGETGDAGGDQLRHAALPAVDRPDPQRSQSSKQASSPPPPPHNPQQQQQQQQQHQQQQQQQHQGDGDGDEGDGDASSASSSASDDSTFEEDEEGDQTSWPTTPETASLADDSDGGGTVEDA